MWQAVARSVRDNVIAEFVVQGVRLGGFVLLARALGPDQFGIFQSAARGQRLRDSEQ